MQGGEKDKKNAITAAGDAIAQGKIPNIEAEAWKSILESLSRDENGDTRTLARNMSVNESVRKEGYGLATAESFNDWRGRGCSKFIPVLGRDGTKIVPPGDLFDQPLGEMSWIRDKLADYVGDHTVLSPEGVVLVTSPGTESSYPRPHQSLKHSAYVFAPEQTAPGKNTLSHSEFDHDIKGLYIFYPREEQGPSWQRFEGNMARASPSTQSAKGWRIRGRNVSEMGRSTRGGSVTGVLPGCKGLFDT